jgi:hypothetical protein
MVDRAHAAWTKGHITGVLLMEVMAAVPSVAKGRQFNVMKIRQMDEDLVRWAESFLSERTVEMILEDNAMERHAVEAGVPQCSPVSPILFAIYTAGLIMWVVEYVSEAKGLSSVDDLGWVATRCYVHDVVAILERCAAKSIEWVSRRWVKFYIAKTEAVQFMRRRDNRKYLRP